MHIPVLHNEVLQVLHPQPGESVVDCTLGLAGHALSFLQATSPDGKLIGLDADAVNLESAKDRLKPFAQRVELHRCNFREVPSLPGLPADIVFADLGLSSPHVDDPERGFTFRASAPLDLRYDRSSGQSAAEFLQSSSVEHIATALKEFGEIQRSKALAQTLSERFRSISSGMTDDVVHCIEKVFTYRSPKVLPQVFQALRIVVNDELGSLRVMLDSLPVILKSGGRCGIISYYSLEDRIVKQSFRALSTPVLDDRTGQVATPADWDLLTRKAIVASATEVSANPRSRSARFRAIRRVPH